MVTGMRNKELCGTAAETIFECLACGYKTNDTYTAGVINDLSGECPECHANAGQPEFEADGKGKWIADGSWYLI